MSTDLHRRLLVRCDPAWFGLRDNPPKVFDALRAAVKHHAPVLLLDLPTCPVCAPIVVDLIEDDGTWTEHSRPAPWPCSTIWVIADALGVAVEDQELIEKREHAQ